MGDNQTLSKYGKVRDMVFAVARKRFRGLIDDRFWNSFMWAPHRRIIQSAMAWEFDGDEEA